MTRPVIPRAQASRDVDGAIDYHLGEGAYTAALGLIDALEQAYATSPRGWRSRTPKPDALARAHHVVMGPGGLCREARCRPRIVERFRSSCNFCHGTMHQRTV